MTGKTLIMVFFEIGSSFPLHWRYSLSTVVNVHGNDSWLTLDQPI